MVCRGKGSTGPQTVDCGLLGCLVVVVVERILG